MFQDLEHEIHLAKVDYYENQSQVPVRRYREPLSNYTGAPSTPTSRSRAAPATSASQPTPSSSRPSSLRHQRSPLPPTLETVLESNSCDMNKKDTCKINVTKSNIARNLVAAADSPFANPKKRKNTDNDDDSVTPGWLKDIFRNPRETVPGRVQLINWRYRSLNNTDRLCLTINDGTAVTKHVISDEDLEEDFLSKLTFIRFLKLMKQRSLMAVFWFLKMFHS